MPLQTLLVLSHLRWSFVYQRPQHFMSRLAGNWNVLFVEEPVHDQGPPWLEIRAVAPNLTVLVPHTAEAQPGFNDAQFPILESLLSTFLQNAGVEKPLVWLYTPMALPLAKQLAPRFLVYDCMDELSAFAHAPLELKPRETELLSLAAVVLTGGPSLFDAKRLLRDDVHCIPSSVDAAHFAATNLQPDGALATRATELQGRHVRPRLGFFGVIDERLDVALVAALADANSEWDLVMAGPVVKIDPGHLPQRDNIRWLGLQSYDLLPYLLTSWDVALMPFARNDSTRFISPTKTLEYMAGGKPVVSTAISDVGRLYGEVVEIAHSHADFISACHRVLAESPRARASRLDNMAALVADYSWDRSVNRIQALLDYAVKSTEPATTPTIPISLRQSGKSIRLAKRLTSQASR